MRPLACKRKSSVPTRTRGKDTGAERWDHEKVKSEVVERNWTTTGYYCHCSVTKSCPTLCSPINCSTPVFLVPHHLLEFAQVHVHRIGDAAQLTHPVIPFSSCLQSFPASESFPMSRLFASSGQSTGASASVLPMSIQSWFPFGLIGLISLL